MCMLNYNTGMTTYTIRYNQDESGHVLDCD